MDSVAGPVVGHVTAAAPRPMRADARRNYERILVVAQEAFLEHGASASLDDIARQAGVGPGTLYRHFPNRSALLDAVYREHVGVICAKAYELAKSEPPFEALAVWLRDMAVNMSAHQGLKAAIAEEGLDLSACREMYYAAGDTLLDRAREIGAIRPGVDVADVFKLIHGCTQGTENSPDPTAQIDRILPIILDGLRAQTR
jgi:AcrR family transcriptional regulator